MSKSISRGTFLKGLLGGFALVATGELVLNSGRSGSRTIPCRLLGPSISVGHKLRDGTLSIPDRPDTLIDSARVVIVGGGIAGLSAAWALKKAGFHDFVLLEMEPEVGGNSRSSKNEISEYPWGAHYVPLANEEAVYVRTLFEELGIIEGYSADGLPIYNELYLCHEPSERLLKDGIFQEGMVPQRGLQPQDKKQIARFFEEIRTFRAAIGRDGKPAFAIPLEYSSTDERFRSLDHISFGAWLNKRGFNSTPLLWYLNYCCRDDYGSTIDAVSAWAGMHYFAGRRGRASNAELNSVVTWPEGNGFLVKKLRDYVGEQIRTSSSVARVSVGNAKNDAERHVNVDVFDEKNNRWLAYKSEWVIFAAPRFLAAHLISGYPRTAASKVSYAPWMVANLAVKRIPHGRGVELSWDNVSYRSPAIGYVDATHQNISTRDGAKVITYYYPLSEKSPAAARQFLLTSKPEYWSQLIIDDLENMHPGISQEVMSIDVWPWGHGMVTPTVGFLWGEERRAMPDPHEQRIYFAHSDMSGMSNFEEAQYHGVHAAERILSEAQPQT